MFQINIVEFNIIIQLFIIVVHIVFNVQMKILVYQWILMTQQLQNWINLNAVHLNIQIMNILNVKIVLKNVKLVQMNLNVSHAKVHIQYLQISVQSNVKQMNILMRKIIFAKNVIMYANNAN
ncbi:unnamed protein product [Paramecium sonneborni]|uniref:Transmembrane protein n=1 Tax=Paramecium sonneborni TaxID=65129 RepID=A0A8S1KXE8_9CILI|nr:unnamed protein product [Paramecium sonneborni]